MALWEHYWFELLSGQVEVSVGLELDNPTILSATFLSNIRFHKLFTCFRCWLCSHSSWYDFAWVAASCSSFVVLEDDLNPNLTRKYLRSTQSSPHILSNLDYCCVCSWSEIFWKWYIKPLPMYFDAKDWSLELLTKINDSQGQFSDLLWTESRADWFSL